MRLSGLTEATARPLRLRLGSMKLPVSIEANHASSRPG